MHITLETVEFAFLIALIGFWPFAMIQAIKLYYDWHLRKLQHEWNAKWAMPQNATELVGKYQGVYSNWPTLVCLKTEKGEENFAFEDFRKHTTFMPAIDQTITIFYTKARPRRGIPSKMWAVEPGVFLEESEILSIAESILKKKE